MNLEDIKEEIMALRVRVERLTWVVIALAALTGGEALKAALTGLL